MWCRAVCALFTFGWAGGMSEDLQLTLAWLCTTQQDLCAVIAETMKTLEKTAGLEPSLYNRLFRLQGICLDNLVACISAWDATGELPSYPCLELLSDALVLTYQHVPQRAVPLHDMLRRAGLSPWTCFGQWPTVFLPSMSPLPPGCSTRSGLCSVDEMLRLSTMESPLLVATSNAVRSAATATVAELLQALGARRFEDLNADMLWKRGVTEGGTLNPEGMFMINPEHQWFSGILYTTGGGWQQPLCAHLQSLCAALLPLLPTTSVQLPHDASEGAYVYCMPPGAWVWPHVDDYKGNTALSYGLNLFGSSLLRFPATADEYAEVTLSEFGDEVLFDPSYYHEVRHLGRHVRCLVAVRFTLRRYLET